jgi:hypothetical protein
VIFGAFTGLVVSELTSKLSLRYGDSAYALRISLVLPVARLFTQHSSTRRLLYMIMKIIVLTKDLLAVLVLIMYIYGMVGTAILSNQFDLLPKEQAAIGNFNDIGNSLVTLFQLLVSDVSCRR